jgi:hypothetical protein
MKGSLAENIRLPQSTLANPKDQMSRNLSGLAYSSRLQGFYDSKALRLFIGCPFCSSDAFMLSLNFEGLVPITDVLARVLATEAIS